MVRCTQIPQIIAHGAKHGVIPILEPAPFQPLIALTHTRLTAI